VIEADYENLEHKQSIFRVLDAALKPSAVLASNTTYLDIDAIAAVTARPGQVVGLHFISPAHNKSLLENLPPAQNPPPV
ncbi:3-hydroxyacyl-CoA dehydrogenase NAD-binding domain-containing protein, partial [Pseudomonas aeruginosa]|uniref:3-hydroxyacyl-CoA dehydrogenase NAD-binding domain-containing protein n=1 Tax=Pseudomonas aeruginosa TaxID=287 RepID=UPI003CC5D371